MKAGSKKILYAILLGVLIFIVLPIVLVYGKYSSFMLISIPFGIGFVFALFVTIDRGLKLERIMGLSFIPILLIVISCITIAGEGAICLIIMGSFLLIPFYIGIIFGHLVQEQIWIRNSVLLLAFFTILSSATSITRYSDDKILQDDLVIPITKEKLWSHLTDTFSFGSSNNFFFKNGVSYPEMMYIECTNTQKNLVCHYNNGVIKAKIIEYTEGRSFAFTFDDSLISMKEKNFYHESHTMHTQNHFEINYGKFEIVELDSARCKLIASTNYRHKFKPEFYTDLWVEYFVGNLHRHVLNAIKNASAGSIKRPPQNS